MSAYLTFFPPTCSLNFASVFAGKLDRPLTTSIDNLGQNHGWKGEFHRHETVALWLVTFQLGSRNSKDMSAKGSITDLLAHLGDLPLLPKQKA